MPGYITQRSLIPARSLYTAIANVRHNYLYYVTISSVHARRQSDRVYGRKKRGKRETATAKKM